MKDKLQVKKPRNDNPLVSIITVVYNGEKHIEKSILSVLNQTYNNIQYIIIDGQSKDNTVNIIKKYQDKISYFISEKDNGIYDAMNKGLKIAKGKYIAILNSDDYYENFAVKKSIENLKQSGADYSIANVCYINKKEVYRPIFPLLKDTIYQEMPYPHVSAFIKKEVYDDIGMFDTNFKIAADHDMALRIHLAGYKANYLDCLIAKLEEGGISNSFDSNKESLKVAIKNGKSCFFAYLTYFLQISKQSIYKLLPNEISLKIQKIKKSRFK